jgi:hypothetical protein
VVERVRHRRGAVPKQKQEVEAQFTEPLDNDKLIVRPAPELMLSMAQNIAIASAKKLQELVAIIERLDTRDRQLVRVVWTPRHVPSSRRKARR